MTPVVGLCPAVGVKALRRIRWTIALDILMSGGKKSLIWDFDLHGALIEKKVQGAYWNVFYHGPRKQLEFALIDSDKQRYQPPVAAFVVKSVMEWLAYEEEN